MAEITAQAVNEFRKKTGLGLMECKTLLKEADGDVKKADELAKAKHGKNAENRAGRATKAGRIEVYIHHDGKRGRWSRSTARPTSSPATRSSASSAKDLAVHILGANPRYVRREDMPADQLEEQKRLFMAQVADKPENIREKIARGQAHAWCGENSVLLDQPFVKDDAKTIRQRHPGGQRPHRREYHGRSLRPVHRRRRRRAPPADGRRTVRRLVRSDRVAASPLRAEELPPMDADAAIRPPRSSAASC